MAAETWVEAVIEIPRGSHNKYEFDQATGVIRLDRVLYSSVHYPADYGFVLDTCAEDGDPLDILVLVEEPTFPGCHVRALDRLIDSRGRLLASAGDRSKWPGQWQGDSARSGRSTIPRIRWRFALAGRQRSCAAFRG